MPRKCCVPECKSNYNSSAEEGFVSVFRFPKEKELRDKWLRQIHRKDFTPTHDSVVCVKHFHESFIDRELRAKRADGTEIVIPRKNPVLTSDAYPSIFENMPSYLTTIPTQRKDPAERMRAVEQRYEAEFLSFMENDKINNFDEFCQEVAKKLPLQWRYFTFEDHCFIMKCDKSMFPNFSASLKISSNLTTYVYHNGIEIPFESLKWLLPEKKCLNWSTFDSLISYTNNYEGKPEDKLKSALNLLERFSENCDDEDEDLLQILKFLIEQLKLTSMKRLRYSTDLLIWACKLFYSYPTAYHWIRDSKRFIVPHPNYLQKFLQSMGDLETEISGPNLQYLKEKFKYVEEHEKLIGLMLDEIYVRPEAEYSGGKIIGKAINSSENAKTLQVFMISSLYSKNKDVLGLYPMANQKGPELYELILRVLKALHEVGYKVLFISADNSKVNRCGYELLGGEELISPIPSPVGANFDIYLLFDTVHLLKTVRNNWLNQHATNKTFFIPILKSLWSEDIDVDKSYVPASLLHLESLYYFEKDDTVKLAPSLSRKALYPSSLERQNVKHAVKLFDDKVICALNAVEGRFGEDVKGTIHFLKIMNKWWKIVNVRTPNGHVKLRDPSRKPICHLSDENIKFLHEFCDWLEAWNNSDVPILSGNKRSYKLSAETQKALLHTTKTLIKLCEFLLNVYVPPPKYILLGKFQTDCLEARFGQYRTMSGCNYNVSVLQILESERKLKLLSLLKLTSSKKGDIPIKNILSSCKEQEEPFEFCKFDNFFVIVEESDFTEITVENRKALIFIAGYIARGAVNNCAECKSKLVLENIMEVENEDIYKCYLGEIDRGGLHWPNDASVNICVCMYKIFQLCISEKFEEEFLNVKNQKSLLVEMSMEKLQDAISADPPVCSCCGKSFKDLVLRCVKVMSNILINNYCKKRNDKKKSGDQSKKRKLTTLQ